MLTRTLKHRSISLCLAITVGAISAASSFGAALGDVRGLVLDPHGAAVKNANVTLKSATSEYSIKTTTDDAGEFSFRAVPIGEYYLSIGAAGFRAIRRTLTVTSDAVSNVNLTLEIAPVSEKVTVSGGPEQINSATSPHLSLIARSQIEETPGADRTNSLSMITNYVPGAYMVHDQLHVRGGHQVSWEIDGVPVPNTNIASNVGPQFDPKDIDYLEVQTGGYSAEFGDRAYGVFNVLPRTGFERDREAELVTSFGNFNQTDNQFSIGDHNERLAYYLSVNGNRTDYGLAAPTASVLHDMASGYGGFGSLVYLPTDKDQLRLVSSIRTDHYQIPNNPDAQSAGIADFENESDAFVNFSWIHTLSPQLLLTISPFYHFNRADFIGGASDVPLSPQERRDSHYAGGQVTLGALTRKHDFRAGLYSFFQHDSSFFGIKANDGSGLNLAQEERINGGLEALFVEDQYKAFSWLTLTGGVRLTYFTGALSENAASPRVGAAIRIPKINLVLRGFYGRYYQAPPLLTVSGPLLELAVTQGFGFLPLKGERDEQYEFGVALPLKGWTFAADYFHTRARNYFDHNAINDSNIFFPLTIDAAFIRGEELTITSPKLFKRASASLAYSHQTAEGAGGITGGLTDFSPPEGGFFLDHDQRHTLNAVFGVDLPSRTFIAGSLHYGSGFLNGEGPDHLPGHTTFDLSAGKKLGENWSVAVHCINLADNRFLLDNSETFGGTHFSDPRQVYVEVRYKFRY